MMNRYKIIEKLDFSSTRIGYNLVAANLKQAKSHAKTNQSFYGTVLVIEQNGEEVARCDKDGNWQ